jgi:hypothetical protein
LIRTIGKFVEVRNASIAGTFNLLDYDLDELMEFDDPRDPQSCIHAAPLADVGISLDGQAEVEAFGSHENVEETRPDVSSPASVPGKSDSPTADSEESCDDNQILRNEANVEFVSGPLSVVRCKIETTHEPCMPDADMNAKDDQDHAAELDREKASKWLWDEVARLAPIRAENLRKLNEECRQEEQQAKASARHIRRRGDKKGQPKVRETPAPNRDQDASCDDDQILRNEANESVSGPLSVVSSPLSVVRCPLSVVSSPLSVVSSPLSVVSAKVETITDAIGPKDPAAALEGPTNEITEGGPDPAGSRKAEIGTLDKGLPGREPAPDLQAQIERVEAHKRLGDEIARRAMIKAENVRKLDEQWWREAEAAEAACRARNRGG